MTAAPASHHADDGTMTSRPPSASPPPGATDSGTVAHEFQGNQPRAAKPGPSAADNPYRCVHIKPNGKRCKTVRTFTTPVGRLCRWHLPNDKPQPPVQRIRDDKDASRVAEWAVLQAARSKIDGKTAASIASLLKEWRQINAIHVSTREGRASDLLLLALLDQFKRDRIKPSRAVTEAFDKWRKLYAKRTGHILPEEIERLDPVEDEEDHD